MIDARKLVPLTEAMVDKLIPMVEGLTDEGNFNISLTVKRRGGKALVDAKLQVLKGK